MTRKGNEGRRKDKSVKREIKQNTLNVDLDSKSMLIYFGIRKKNKRKERQRKGNKGMHNSN